MTKTPATKTAARTVQDANRASEQLIAKIHEMLPACGPEATWADAGTAEQVRLSLAEIVRFLGCAHPNTIELADGTRVCTACEAVRS